MRVEICQKKASRKFQFCNSALRRRTIRYYAFPQFIPEEVLGLDFILIIFWGWHLKVKIIKSNSGVLRTQPIIIDRTFL